MNVIVGVVGVLMLCYLAIGLPILLGDAILEKRKLRVEERKQKDNDLAIIKNLLMKALIANDTAKRLNEEQAETIRQMQNSMSQCFYE